MTWRSVAPWVVLFVASACGGSNTVDIDSGGGGPDGAPPDTGVPPDDGGPLDGTVPPADGGTDGPSLDGGGFSPLSLTGLALWLDAEHKTTLDNNNRLQTWGDLSGNANDATQTNMNARPTVTASAINNLPAVHFEGVGTGPYLSIADATSLQWGAGDFLIAVVARFSNNPANGFTTGAADFYWKSTFTGNAGAGVGFLGNLPTPSYTVTTGMLLILDQPDYVYTATPYNDAAARVYLVHRTGATLELRVNASSIATQTAPNTVDVSAVGTPALIGAIANGTYYRLAGDIAEMIAVKGPISTPDLASLETYLKGKYGL